MTDRRQFNRTNTSQWSAVQRGVRPHGEKMEMERIVVLGTTGSGKSTFAKRVAKALGAKYVELDALHWHAGWRQAPPEEFRENLSLTLEQPAWVVDGNYLSARDLIWPRATLIVWLDYGFARVFARLFRRSIRRLLNRELLFNGNRESARTLFLSRDSLFLWAIESHPQLSKQIPAALREYPHIHSQVFRHPSEAESFLRHLEHAD